RTLRDQGVGARPAVEDVDAAVADQHVVALAAQEGVVVVAADQDVRPLAAVGDEADRAGVQGRAGDDVVSTQRVDRQFIGRLVPGNVHLGRRAGDRYAVGVACGVDGVTGLGAVDG